MPRRYGGKLRKQSMSLRLGAFAPWVWLAPTRRTMAVSGGSAIVRSSTGRFEKHDCDRFANGRKGEDGHWRPDRHCQGNGTPAWLGAEHRGRLHSRGEQAL